ncbi:shikimate kinase [Caldicoprobacter guelmensis]|uniref:shikimate kinase n=1 Tax=Caldicoprobacter guelmensis TaxID=1170224 RepID=UPI001959F2B1|nr:shikimate kinase [Caldicoprobacter guelmensis]MBM7581276.1 shikimate kinase [Caldicoprobacter guelmensis]
MRNKYNNIILIGFMGVGKTTVGKLLAQRLGYRFVDADQVIEEETGLSIPEIFSRYGEGYFRQLERQAIRRIFIHSGIVLATGGGAVMDPANFSFLMENGCVVALDASEETLWERLKSCKDRPMLYSENPREKMRALLEMRRPVYYKAHFVVRVDGKSPKEVADEIIAMLEVEGGDGDKK